MMLAFVQKLIGSYVVLIFFWLALGFIFGTGMKSFLAIFSTALIFHVLFASRQKERKATIHGETIIFVSFNSSIYSSLKTIPFIILSSKTVYEKISVIRDLSNYLLTASM